MKFLCICNCGHSRSVAMCRSLHHKGHEAVPAGYGTASSAIPMLANWADFVVLMEPGFADAVPFYCRDKIAVNDVGPDVWSNPYNPDLRALCDRFRDGKGW